MTDKSFTCRGCGCQFTGSKRIYCTKKCRSKTYSYNKYRSQGRKTREEISANAACNQIHDCLACGKMFKPKRAGRIMACSRECGFKIKGAIQKIKNTGGRVWVRTKRNVPVVIRREKADHPPKPSSCNRCGSFYYPTKKHQQLCSDECREAGRLETKRKAKSLRRARIRGSTVSEGVDPFKVFDRDGWRCQICFRKTPRSKRGTIDDRAPELDHIVPLAKGGDHSYDNTQCACRRCNGLKGDEVYGQIPMFAT